MRANLAVEGVDGTCLATDVYLPRRGEPVPVVVTRTPYGRSAHMGEGLGWRARGFGYVVQDVRGRYGSDGSWQPYHNERDDGRALARWLERQPWCDGTVVAAGNSYGAYTAWALAVSAPGLVRAVISAVPAMGTRRVKYDPSGILRLNEHVTWWLEHADSRVSRSGIGAAMLAEEPGLLGHLPVSQLPERLWARVPGWAAVVEAGASEGAEAIGDEELADLDVAALHLGGFYDLLVDETVRLWELAGTACRPRPTRRLVLGPWGHALAWAASTTVADRHHAAWSRLDLGALQVDWLRSVLDPTVPATSSSAVYLAGEEVWQESTAWPPPRAGRRVWHTTGHGGLAAVPGPSSVLRYTYDPLNPTPSRPPGANRAGLDGRTDAVRFRTAPLPGALRLEGRPIVDLRARTSAASTDWIVRLSERSADGGLFALAQVSAVADGTGEHELVLPPVAVSVPAGSRLELEIASSDFPFLARNLNTGADRYATAATTRAVQTVAAGEGGTTLHLPGCAGR